MVDQVHVTQDDIPIIQDIFNILKKALNNVPETVLKNSKYSVLLMMAIFNFACFVAQGIGVAKHEFIRAIEKIWDDKIALANGSFQN